MGTLRSLRPSQSEALEAVPILDLARIIALRRSVTRAGSSRTIASFSSIMIP